MSGQDLDKTQLQMRWGVKLIDAAREGKCRIINYPTALRDVNQIIGSAAFTLKKIKSATFDMFMDELVKANASSSTRGDDNNVMRLVSWNDGRKQSRCPQRTQLPRSFSFPLPTTSSLPAGPATSSNPMLTLVRLPRALRDHASTTLNRTSTHALGHPAPTMLNLTATCALGHLVATMRHRTATCALRHPPTTTLGPTVTRSLILPPLTQSSLGLTTPNLTRTLGPLPPPHTGSSYLYYGTNSHPPPSGPYLTDSHHSNHDLLRIPDSAVPHIADSCSRSVAVEHNTTLPRMDFVARERELNRAAQLNSRTRAPVNGGVGVGSSTKRKALHDGGAESSDRAPKHRRTLEEELIKMRFMVEGQQPGRIFYATQLRHTDHPSRADAYLFIEEAGRWERMGAKRMPVLATEEDSERY
ncbi:hypothetical protein MVEN_00045100 [Mycena venus]|uniref:Uncharacterized protein n=1 Tax=Mycena venus TaxID=2733690 RepID=A0A8H6Z6J5_9AGAR|nr:hypothetical protein MVEN_00045100 [Mycena venus]